MKNVYQLRYVPTLFILRSKLYHKLQSLVYDPIEYCFHKLSMETRGNVSIYTLFILIDTSILNCYQNRSRKKLILNRRGTDEKDWIKFNVISITKKIYPKSRFIQFSAITWVPIKVKSLRMNLSSLINERSITVLFFLR